jgi:hypothetical protein
MGGRGHIAESDHPGAHREASLKFESRPTFNIFERGTVLLLDKTEAKNLVTQSIEARRN